MTILTRPSDAALIPIPVPPGAQYALVYAPKPTSRWRVNGALQTGSGASEPQSAFGQLTRGVYVYRLADGVSEVFHSEADAIEFAGEGFVGLEYPQADTAAPSVIYTGVSPVDFTTGGPNIDLLPWTDVGKYWQVSLWFAYSASPVGNPGSGVAPGQLTVETALPDGTVVSRYRPNMGSSSVAHWFFQWGMPTSGSENLGGNVDMNSAVFEQLPSNPSVRTTNRVSRVRLYMAARGDLPVRLTNKLKLWGFPA